MSNSAPFPEGCLDRRIEYLSLAKLKPAARNPKKHDLETLDSSVSRFGFVEPIVLDERTGLLVAGHGRVKTLATKHARHEEAPAGIKAKEGQWLVPVLRGWASKDDVEAEAYLLASNRLVEAGGWDESALAEMLRDLSAIDGGLDGVGFSDDVLGELLDTANEVEAEDNDVPATPKAGDVYVKAGDLWQLGEHLLLCGDSTRADSLDRVLRDEKADIVWTDPPWNVALVSDGEPLNAKRKKRDIESIANDNLGERFPEFVAAFVANIARAAKPGAPLYMAMSIQEVPTIDAALKRAGFHWSSTIVWAKDVFVLSRRDYHSQWEPIWYGWKDGAPRLVEVEDRTQSDVWAIPRPKSSDEHPTMKPVELITRALENSSRRSALVYEPFSGSGSTLLACERTGRRCRAVELEPTYVQVAIERWKAATGGEPKRLG